MRITVKLSILLFPLDLSKVELYFAKNSYSRLSNSLFNEFSSPSFKDDLSNFSIMYLGISKRMRR